MLPGLEINADWAIGVGEPDRTNDQDAGKHVPKDFSKVLSDVAQDSAGLTLLVSGGNASIGPWLTLARKPCLRFMLIVCHGAALKCASVSSAQRIVGRTR
jgi:hypothetical protein